MHDQKPQNNVTAWDPLLRIFHWSLVLFFFIAYLTEDDWLDLHVQAGYLVLGLVGFRLLWGLIGPRTARFASFIRSPSKVRHHLQSMLQRNAPHYLGHNPVAAVMVVALLVSILLVSFSGLIALASEGQGPLANTWFGQWHGEWTEEVHEFFSHLTLLLIFGHIAGVVVSSLLEGENLVRAMLTGRKRNRTNWADAPDNGDQA